VNNTLPRPVGRPIPAVGAGLPRVFTDTTGIVAHEQRFGPLPAVDGRLIDVIARSGLRGRGGAGFPTARKLAAVAAGRGPRVVVANGTESEPLSAKDKNLIARSPHLVLDGLTLAGDVLGALRRIVCVERSHPVVEQALRGACDERADQRIEIVLTPRRYSAGQETALVDLIDGGIGKPTLRRPFERGVDGRPTLVDNVETLAQIALIARYGPQWYAHLGTDDEPGSALLTVTGNVGRSAVYEIPFGYPLGDLLRSAGAPNPRAVLVGGYFGRWLPGEVAMAAQLSRASLAPLGADIGCGVIVALDADTCAVDELSRVAGWFAANSAGQCGACTWGLRDLAQATQAVDAGGAGRSTVADIGRWSSMVKGRGACRLPDGAASFLESGLAVFADEIEEHRVGRCHRQRNRLLPTPSPEAWA
jgi:NADH:ubiquinone oxidoreductase subunit F (NADH-binding)